MNSQRRLMKIIVGVLLFLAGPTTTASAQALGVILDDRFVYRARLRRTGYDKWNATLERGMRSDFTGTMLSSDILRHICTI